MNNLSELEKRILMELQYRFSLSEEPYLEIARKLNIEFKELKRVIDELRKKSVIKRLGFNINYKASGKVAALVAAKTDENQKKRLSKILFADKEVTHNYVRNHNLYNVWFVIKRKSQEELLKDVKSVLESIGVSEYVVLLGKRTYKLSVKFDLYKMTSWSEPEVLPERVPTFDEMGLPKEPFSLLSRFIPVVERPFKEIGERYGFKEGELVDILRELYNKRVIRNLGATLEGSQVGITEDGMVVMKANEEACNIIASKVPEATHVVFRIPIHGEWDYPAYFMLHSDSKEKIESIAKNASELLGGVDYMIIYSLENLKPGLHSNE